MGQACKLGRLQQGLLGQCLVVNPSPAAVRHLQAEQPDHEFRRHHQKPLPALGLEGKLQDVKKFHFLPSLQKVDWSLSHPKTDK